jgi:hypothetical protein
MHIISERSQSEKAIHCMIPNLWHSEKQNYGDRRKISGARSGSGCGKDG